MANELKFGNKVVFLGGNPISLPIATSDPGSAVNGDMYYNSTSNRVRVYQGGGWVDLATGSGGVSTGVAGKIALYPSNGSVVDDIYVQNSQNISLEIAAQGSRSAALVYTLPNPGDAVTAADVILSEGSQAINGTLELANDVTLSALTPSTPLKLDGSGKIISSDIDLTTDVSGILPINAGGTNSSTSLNNNRVMKSAGGAIVEAAAITASRALISDSNGIPVHSTVTSTELGYVSGVSSSIQTQLNNKADAADLADYILLTEKGASGGVATLDGGGKIPASQLPNSVIELQGQWNASTNSPTLADGVGNPGDVYEVTVAGTQNLGSGNITFAVGDWVVYGASAVWYKSVNSNAVTSVNGLSGVVVLDTDDILEGANLYFTDERAQDAVGAMVADSSKVSLTYTDGTPSLVANIVAGSLVNADISASAAIALTKLAALNNNIVPVSNGSGFLTSSSVTATELGYLSGVTSAIQTQLNAKANAALSNLASVAINTSLISDTDNTDDLGSAGVNWKDVHAKQLLSSTDLVLRANGTNIDLQGSKVRRVESAGATNYMEEQYFDALSLSANVSSPTAISSLTFAIASYASVVIEYMIKEASSGKIRTGKMLIAADGTGNVVSSSDVFSETAALGAAAGLSLDTNLSAGNVSVRYNNTHASNAATMRCVVKRYRA